jgi:hypothetical protein
MHLSKHQTSQHAVQLNAANASDTAGETKSKCLLTGLK